MTGGERTNGAGASEPPDAESLEPLDMSPEASEPEEAGSDRFARGVKRAIQRRLFGASIVEFCVIGPGIVVAGLLVGIAGYRRFSRRAPERKDDDQ